MINSNNSAILLGALDFFQTIILQFVLHDRNSNGWQPSQHLNGVQDRSGLPTFLYFCYDISSFAKNNSLIDVSSTKSIPYL